MHVLSLVVDWLLGSESRNIIAGFSVAREAFRSTLRKEKIKIGPKSFSISSAGRFSKDGRSFLVLRFHDGISVFYFLVLGIIRKPYVTACCLWEMQARTLLEKHDYRTQCKLRLWDWAWLNYMHLTCHTCDSVVQMQCSQGHSPMFPEFLNSTQSAKVSMHAGTVSYLSLSQKIP